MDTEVWIEFCLRHGDHAYRYLSGIPAWQDCLEPVSNRFLTDALAGSRHGTLAYRYFRAIPAWRSGLLAGFWHSDPTHRYLRSTLAWQRGLLTGLRHGE